MAAHELRVGRRATYVLPGDSNLGSRPRARGSKADAPDKMRWFNIIPTDGAWGLGKTGIGNRTAYASDLLKAESSR